MPMTPAAPKRLPMSRLRRENCEMKRRKISTSPVATSLLPNSSFLLSPPPSIPSSSPPHLECPFPSSPIVSASSSIRSSLASSSSYFSSSSSYFSSSSSVCYPRSSLSPLSSSFSHHPQSPFSSSLISSSSSSSLSSVSPIKSSLIAPSPFSSSSPPSSSSFSSDCNDLTYLNKHFLTLRKLGAGNFGEVIEAQSRHSSDKYAIKISKVTNLKDLRSGLNYIREHLNEVRAHSSIAPHPNLVQFHLAWKEQGTVYMLLELCEGSLEGYWRKMNHLTQHDIHTVLKHMLMALAHLSSLNIVHLDVKPANILRCASGHYKLADFSVALDLNKDSSGPEGDRRYAAPELLDGSTEQLHGSIFSPKADLFSLGVSLIQVSTLADEPLTEDEWREMQTQGIVPASVAEALIGPLNLAKTVETLISTYDKRPSVEEIIIGEAVDSIEAALDATMLENKYIHEAVKRDRLSLPSSCERKMREEKSPLEENSEPSRVIFHTEERFYEMERKEKSLRERLSMGGKRAPRALRF